MECDLQNRITLLFIMNRLTAFNKFAFAVFATQLLASCLLCELKHHESLSIYFPIDIPTNGTFYKNSRVRQHSEYPKHSLPSVVIGELPGYTGWARPDSTDAPFYRIEYTSPQPHDVNQVFTIVVTCKSEKCSTRLWAQFYVRMYGPSILTGQVTSLDNYRYKIEFLPRFPGNYWVEVVLTFSKGEDVGNFPLSKSKAARSPQDPAYEGFLIAGFPFGVEVSNERDVTIPTESRFCQIHDLEVQSLYDGLRLGSWKVINKVNWDRYKKLHNKRAVTLRGYQEGRNSLGVWTKFQPTNCNLIPIDLWSEVLNGHHSCFKDIRLHLVFIGDSVMVMQMKLMLNLTNTSINVTMIRMKGGIIQNIDYVTSELQRIDPTQEVIVIFNSGLHDIGLFCSGKNEKLRPLSMRSPEQYLCVEEYQEKLTLLARAISSFPTRLNIFQTTSAGWMKWGNYGAAWLPSVEQPFSLSPHFVHQLNNIAFRVFDEFKNIVAIDAYWLSLARPDNREVDRVNSVGKHLVHPGLDVLEAMTRSWMNLVLSRLDCI
jgi:hypothetical protein